MRIEAVSFDGVPLPYDDGAVPPKGRRSLAFYYLATGTTPSDVARYQFRMEGLEEEWADAGQRTAAFYRELDPGTYTFRVRAIEEGGRWETETSLPVVIEPHFYETALFRLFLLLLLVGLVGAGYRWKTRAIRVRSEHLERMVEERTRALQAERDRAEGALRKAEHAFATVEEQALQLLRMDHVKSRLFATLSHEFRTPLTLILDPLDRTLAGDLGPLGDDVRDALERARLNARRLLRLINQLLDLAELEAGEKELCAREEDLVLLLRFAAEVYTQEAGLRGVTLLFRPDVKRLPAYIDRQSVEKVLSNLLSNALKVTPPGGTVTLTTQVIEAEDGSSDAVEIAVRDAGPAIPEDEIPYVLDRFYQAGEGPQNRGGGIGLALVRELAELHRGEVRVESAPGIGNTFTVRFPLGRGHLADHEITEAEATAPFSSWEVRPEDSGATTAASQDPGPETGSDGEARPLVLVVDDSPELRALIRLRLSRHYSVIEAADGEAALRLISDRNPDLVLSDVLMPGMDGLELCRRIKGDDRLVGTPVLLLTARATEEQRIEGLEVGADDYLTKPFSSEELLVRVGNLIRTRDAMREHYSHEVVLQPFGLCLPSADAAFMEEVFGVIEAHLPDGAFTVAELAEEIGLSQAQLKRKLRALADQSPVELIRAYRLERAAELLRAETGRVGEVAYAVGFESASYFARCFRARFGVSPSHYAGRE